MSVGAKVQEARIEMGMSRDELARKSRLTPRTIFRIERDESWSRGSLSLLARELGIPFDDLIHESEGTAASTRRGKNDGDTAAVGSRSDVPYSHEGV